MLYVEI